MMISKRVAATMRTEVIKTMTARLAPSFFHSNEVAHSCEIEGERVWIKQRSGCNGSDRPSSAAANNRVQTSVGLRY